MGQVRDLRQGLGVALTCTDGYPLACFQGNTHRIDVTKWLMFPWALKEDQATGCCQEQ